MEKKEVISHWNCPTHPIDTSLVFCQTCKIAFCSACQSDYKQVHSGHIITAKDPSSKKKEFDSKSLVLMEAEAYCEDMVKSLPRADRGPLKKWTDILEIIAPLLNQRKDLHQTLEQQLVWLRVLKGGSLTHSPAQKAADLKPHGIERERQKAQDPHQSQEDLKKKVATFLQELEEAKMKLDLNDGRNPAQMLLATYPGEIADNLQQLVRQYTDYLGQVAKLQADIKDLDNKIKTQQKTDEQEKTKQKNKIADLQKTINTLQSDKAGLENDIASKEKAKAYIEKELKSKEDEIANKETNQQNLTKKLEDQCATNAKLQAEEKQLNERIFKLKQTITAKEIEIKEDEEKCQKVKKDIAMAEKDKGKLEEEKKKLEEEKKKLEEEKKKLEEEKNKLIKEIGDQPKSSPEEQKTKIGEQPKSSPEVQKAEAKSENNKPTLRETLATLQHKVQTEQAKWNELSKASKCLDLLHQLMQTPCP